MTVSPADAIEVGLHPGHIRVLVPVEALDDLGHDHPLWPGQSWGDVDSVRGDADQPPNLLAAHGLGDPV
jgi:hypothetical protein